MKARNLLVLVSVTVLLLTGAACVNYAPSISSVVAEPDRVVPQGTCTITCTADDPDDDSLSYSWTEDGWAIEEEGNPLIWTAPKNEGTYVIGVTVSDGNGGEISSQCVVVVDEDAIPTPTPTPAP
jgi:hypothetical protein